MNIHICKSGCSLRAEPLGDISPRPKKEPRHHMLRKLVGWSPQCMICRPTHIGASQTDSHRFFTVIECLCPLSPSLARSPDQIRFAAKDDAHGEDDHDHAHEHEDKKSDDKVPLALSVVALVFLGMFTGRGLLPDFSNGVL